MENLNGWIPVEDRLPDVIDEYYLCTESNGNVRILKYEDLGNGCFWMEGCESANVIAWQPLPKPYCPKRSQSLELYNQLFEKNEV